MERSLMDLWKCASAASVAVCFAATPALAANPDTVIGTWKTTTRNGVVAIERCGESLCGKLVSSDHLKQNPDLRDAANKDTAKRTRKLKDLQILGGFKRESDAWTGGTIYNAEDGATYKATITPAGADTLKLKGCVVWPLCKTQTWTRVK